MSCKDIFYFCSFCFVFSFKFYLFIFWLRWVFVAARGLSLVAVSGLLIEVASLVAEHGLQAHGLQQLWHASSVVVARGLSSCGSRALERRLNSCGARAQLLCGMWDLPVPGLEPVFRALAGRFLTTVPPEKSLQLLFVFENFILVQLSSNGKY